MEVEAGKLATEKATAQACKEFAQRMVKDHSEANEKLSKYAQSKGLTVPSVLDQKHQKHSAELASKSGPAFDRAYADMMVKDHQKTVALFERQERSGNDSDLKTFAKETLPTLREHLKLAQEMQANLKSGSQSSQ